MLEIALGLALLCVGLAVVGGAIKLMAGIFHGLIALVLLPLHLLGAILALVGGLLAIPVALVAAVGALVAILLGIVALPLAPLALLVALVVVTVRWMRPGRA